MEVRSVMCEGIVGRVCGDVAGHFTEARMLGEFEGNE